MKQRRVGVGLMPDCVIDPLLMTLLPGGHPPLSPIHEPKTMSF